MKEMKYSFRQSPLVQCCEYNETADFPYVSIDDIYAAEINWL